MIRLITVVAELTAWGVLGAVVTGLWLGLVAMVARWVLS